MENWKRSWKKSGNLKSSKEYKPWISKLFPKPIKWVLSVVIKCVNIIQRITISLYTALSYSFQNTGVRYKSAIYNLNQDNKYPHLFRMGVALLSNCRALPGKMWFWKDGCLWELVAQGALIKYKCTFVVQILVSKPYTAYHPKANIFWTRHS